MSISRAATGSNGAATSTLTLTTSSSSSTPAPSSSPQPPPSVSVEPTLSERELYKVEFFKTYDVMTGVRIAATLGGFFSLMIFLVIYKSKCRHGTKSIASEAAVVAAAELDAVSELPFDGAFSSPRISLGNMSAPAASLRTRYSNSSYVNMLNFEPKSLPGSVMGWMSQRGSHQWSEPPYRQRASLDHNATASRNSSFLTVPGVRLSSTGSTSDSSYYLEHRSLMELGLPPVVIVPHGRSKGHASGDAAQSPNCTAIDINVIQPTPDISPCNSEKQLHRQLQRRALMLAAPLASCGSATLTELPDDARSIGSDSVFFNDEFWLGSGDEDATLCDSCSEDACSDDSCAHEQCCCGGGGSGDEAAHARWTGSGAGDASTSTASVKQGPNVVQCSNHEAFTTSVVENAATSSSPSSPRELSSHSNKMTEVASSLVLDQLANKVDGNNELITETVF